MYKAIKFRITSTAPLLMHNGRLADPLNEFSRAMKKVSSKRKKTDEDYAELAKVEFLGSLYVNEDGAPVIPGELIEAAITSGAKKTKKGKDAKAGIIVDGNFPLQYTGPKHANDLVEDGNFRHVAGVRVGQARVMRTRPKFNKWDLEFVVHYLPGTFDEKEVVEFVETAGRVAGLGDNRPRFGRFDVVSHQAA